VLDKARTRDRKDNGGEQRLSRIPFFVRAMARRSIERYARELGDHAITVAVMDRICGYLGL
jgi:hypothetical protein